MVNIFYREPYNQLQNIAVKWTCNVTPQLWQNCDIAPTTFTNETSTTKAIPKVFTELLKLFLSFTRELLFIVLIVKLICGLPSTLSLFTEPSWTLCTLTVPGRACWPVLPVQLVLLCKWPLSTMTSTPYSLPGMRPGSWMRYSVLSFPRVALSTRAVRFHRSRWYLSQSPAGGTQLTRRDRSQPPATACSSQTFWGTAETHSQKQIMNWAISAEMELYWQNLPRSTATVKLFGPARAMRVILWQRLAFTLKTIFILPHTNHSLIFLLVSDIRNREPLLG